MAIPLVYGGGYIDRGEVWRTSTKTTTDNSAEPVADARFLLNTTVPDYWFPLLPKKIPGGNGDIRFVLGKAPATDANGEPVAQEALGRILKGLEDSFLIEEELPREGLEVTRSYKMARWVNGETYVWIGRRKRVGVGEGSSGLKWDMMR